MGTLGSVKGNSRGHWEHYPHPADMGIRGFGDTRDEAFAQAALAMTAIVTPPEKIKPKTIVEVICEEDDDEMLLWYWLNAVLYEMDTRNMLFNRFEIQAFDGGLRAKLIGQEIDIRKHNPAVGVKAATYADLKVQQRRDGQWIAQCIVDV